MQKTLFKKEIIVVIIGLFICTNFASSSGIKSTNLSNPILIDEVVSSKELFRGKIAYGWVVALGPYGEGPCCFDLDDPGNITQISTYLSPWWPSGGTWTNCGRWLGVEGYAGNLWEIYPENGDYIDIGGGGVPLNGLAYNPVNDKLYGAANFDFYEINITTGNLTYIGAYGEGPEHMIGIAFDSDGILYGWDIGNDSLWTINTETGIATLVGPLGIDIKYAQDGAFDIETDILYLSAWTVYPYVGSYLYECDEDTGNCTLVGQFDGEQTQITALAIPYNLSNHPPGKPKIKGPYIIHGPGPHEYTFKAIDPDGDNVSYQIDWDDGDISDWTSWYLSGEEITRNHTYDYKDDFKVKARAKDIHGAIGDWGVIVRKSKQIINLPLIQFLMIIIQFPLLKQLLVNMMNWRV
jgi:hypothetical protein